MTSVQVLKHPQMTWKVSLWERPGQVSIWVLGDFRYKVPMGPLAVAAVPSEFCGTIPSWTRSFVFGRPLWQSQRWASFPITRGTETHQESVPLLGEAAVCFGDRVVFRWATTWAACFNSQLRLAVGLLLTWPTRCVACSRRSNSKDLGP